MLTLGMNAQYIQTFPWTEDFENQSTCGVNCGNACNLSGSDFTNVTSDDFDWTADVNGTGSGSTGPTANGGADHNPGISGGVYLYTETSGSCSGGDESNLVSPYYDFTGFDIPYLEFWFHMYGTSMGTMHLDIDTTQGNAWVNDYITAWTDNDDSWQQQLVSLHEFTGLDSFRFRIRGISGTSFGSDMAVDDFTVGDTSFSVGAVVIQPSCDGFSDGAIYVDGIFGVSPFTFAWSNGSTNDSITGLAEGTYTVTITDDNNNTAVDSFVLDVPAIVSTSSVLQDLVCDYDIAIGTVTATGGTPVNQSYLSDTTSANFDPEATTNATEVLLGDDQLSGWLPIGFDFVFFGDTFDEFRISSNGFMQFDPNSAGTGCCTGQNFPNATLPNAVIALNWEDLDPDNGNDGHIFYETIGTSPDQILIVTFEDVAYFGGSFGDVSVQAKLYQNSGCIELHTIDVSSDGSQTQGIEDLGATEGITYPGRNATPWSGTGDFISFCPPVGGLTYLWPDGSTDTINIGLAPGEHVVTIADGNGCSITDTVTISAPLSALELNPTITDISCFGAADGMIESNAANGVTPYTYMWSDNQTTADASGLVQGDYGVTVTDNLGCIDSVNDMYVDEPPLLYVAITGITNTTCPDSMNGAASAIAQGGIPPYTYSWLPSGAGGASVTGLGVANHQVIVTDANGCQSVQTASVLSTNSAPSVDLGPDQIITGGQSVTLDAGSQSAYMWSSGATSATITAASTGTYWVVVTNDEGCSATDTVYIEIWPTGIEELGNNSLLSLFPNPVGDMLSMTLDSDGAVTGMDVIITNAQGQIVLSQTAMSLSPGETVSFDVSELAPGAYNMLLKSDDMNANQSFIKQ